MSKHSHRQVYYISDRYTITELHLTKKVDILKLSNGDAHVEKSTVARM